tara:strand:+ start:41598 stop:42848 length:1251 start_codon:yes stop_codon:yes gene_type:complete
MESMSKNITDELTRNAEVLADLVWSRGYPDIEETTLPIALSSKSVGVASSGFKVLVESVQSEAFSGKQSSYVAKQSKNVETILYSLIAAGFAFEHLSLGTKIVPGHYIDSIGLTKRHVQRIRDVLLDRGLMELTRVGFKHHGDPSKSRPAQYYPSESLIRQHCHLLYCQVGDFDDYEPYQYKGDRWDSNEAKNVEILRRYNDFMRDHSWAQKQPTTRKLGEDPFTSGRVYTAYQTIAQRRVPIRSKTLLDGKPLFEVDFSSNHPWLLAKLFDQQLPVDAWSDISAISGCSRADVKKILVSCLGSTKPSQLNQIKYKLYSLSSETIDNVIDSAGQVMPWLKDNNLLFSGVGNTLQYLEGEIALKMFDWAVENEIPILNVHDAYACNLEHKEIVSEVMHRYRDEVVEENRGLVSSLGS